MANETNVNLTKMSNIPVFTGDIDHWIGGSATTAKSWADAAAESAANALNSAILAQQMKEAVDDALRTPDTVVYGGLDLELYWCQLIVLKRESLPSGDVLDIGIHIPAYDTLNVNMMLWIKPDTNTPWPYYLSIHDLDIVEDRAHYLGWIATSQNANELLMHASSPYELHWRFEGVSLRPGMRLKLRFLPAITQQQEAQYNIGTYTHLDQTDFGAHDNTTKSGYRQLPYIPVLYKNDNAGNGIYKVNASPSETVTVWEPTYSAAVDFSMSADLASVVLKAGDYATEARAYSQQATASAASALLSETNAATSATNAASSASTASSKASEAATSANTASSKAAAASTSEANALTYKGLAEAAKTAAEAAKTAAETAKSGADAAKEEATRQAASASTSATTATNKAGEASTSATNAAASASSAAASATTATNKAAFATEEANRAEAAATGMQDLYDTTLEAATLAVSAYESSVTALEASHGFAEEARQAKETAVAAAATVTDLAERAEAAAQTAESIAEEVAASVSTATLAAIEATSSKNIAVTAKNEATAAAISALASALAASEAAAMFTPELHAAVASLASGSITYNGNLLVHANLIWTYGAPINTMGGDVYHGEGSASFTEKIGDDIYNSVIDAHHFEARHNGDLKVHLHADGNGNAILELNGKKVLTEAEQALIVLDAAGIAPTTVLKHNGVYNISIPATVSSFNLLALSIATPSSLGETIAHVWITLEVGTTTLTDQAWPAMVWVNEINTDEPPVLERGKEYLIAILRRGNYIAANIALTK